MEKPQPIIASPAIRKSKYTNSFISGGLAGIVAKSVIAPFDRIKILFIVYFLCIFTSQLIIRPPQDPSHIKLLLTRQFLFQEAKVQKVYGVEIWRLLSEFSLILQL